MLNIAQPVAAKAIDKPAWGSKVFEIPVMPETVADDDDDYADVSEIGSDGANKNTETKENDTLVLVLKNFQRLPPIDFGTAKVGGRCVVRARAWCLRRAQLEPGALD